MAAVTFNAALLLPAFSINVSSLVSSDFKKDFIDMVFLDEVQFLDTSETIQNVEIILNEGIDVVCAGLDQDSRGKPWETSSMILGLSDKILKIYVIINEKY